MLKVKRKIMKEVALERINILFRLGVDAVRKGSYDIARRYGELIYAISTRVRVKIPHNIKRWICKNCRVIMIPGINAMVRTRRKRRTLRIVTRCLVCGWSHRYEFLRYN